MMKPATPDNLHYAFAAFAAGGVQHPNRAGPAHAGGGHHHDLYLCDEGRRGCVAQADGFDAPGLTPANELFPLAAKLPVAGTRFWPGPGSPFRR
jgi:hypothetical protein